MQECLADESPAVVAAGLDCVALLCEADVLEFYAAWRVVHRALPRLPEHPAAAAAWVRRSLPWQWWRCRPDCSAAAAADMFSSAVKVDKMPGCIAAAARRCGCLAAVAWMLPCNQTLRQQL